MKLELIGRNVARTTALGLVLVALAGCEVLNGGDGISDVGIDGGLLQDGLANIWVDPDGCQHWYVDDGVEGYMSPRLNRDGTPKCQDTRGAVTMKDGTSIATEPEPAIPAG